MKRHLGPRIIFMVVILALFSLAITVNGDDSEWVAPFFYARRKNPVPADANSIARGKEVYIKNCLSCHGAEGKGDGPQAKDLTKTPGDLTSEKTQKQSDGALFWKITVGRKPMPSHEKLLTENQRWDVVNYLRTLAAKTESKS